MTIYSKNVHRLENLGFDIEIPSNHLVFPMRSKSEIYGIPLKNINDLNNLGSTIIEERFNGGHYHLSLYEDTKNGNVNSFLKGYCEISLLFHFGLNSSIEQYCSHALRNTQFNKRFLLADDESSLVLGGLGSIKKYLEIENKLDLTNVSKSIMDVQKYLILRDHQVSFEALDFFSLIVFDKQLSELDVDLNSLEFKLH